ncbi:MAG: hypothetical protein U0W24_25695 [Bacteroidales bacterium]
MKSCCLIFLLVSIFCGCLDRAPDNRKLKIYNKSNDIIYFFISEKDEFSDPYQDYSEKAIDAVDKVKQDTLAYFIDNPINWEEYIKDCQDGKMRLFIVAKDSVDKYGLKMVISKSIFTKKYLIDIEYLNKVDWSIKYEDK